MLSMGHALSGESLGKGLGLPGLLPCSPDLLSVGLQCGYRLALFMKSPHLSANVRATVSTILLPGWGSRALLDYVQFFPISEAGPSSKPLMKTLGWKGGSECHGKRSCTRGFLPAAEAKGQVEGQWES